MDPRRYERLRRAFERVIELDPAKRDEALARLAAFDPRTAAAVQNLLSVDPEGGSLRILFQELHRLRRVGTKDRR